MIKQRFETLHQARLAITNSRQDYHEVGRAIRRVALPAHWRCNWILTATEIK
jgi:hypothetical protein